MNKLIIVCGLPGSGKTILADEIAKKMGIVCIHKDSIKEKLFESLAMSTFEDSKRIGKPSIDVMLHLAEQQIANGIDIIIEAPFNFPEDYQIFNDWAKRYNILLFSVICSIDSNERKYRIETRERHKSHFDNLRTNNYFPENEYDYALAPGKQIRVQTDRPLTEIVKEVIDQLN